MNPSSLISEPRVLGLNAQVHASVRARALLFIASVIYASALAYCLSGYAAVELSEYGFAPINLTLANGLIVLCALLIWAATVPMQIRAVSDLLLVVVYLMLCIPVVVTSLQLQDILTSQHFVLVVVIVVGLAAACIGVAIFRQRPEARLIRLPHPRLGVLFISAWTTCAIYLLLRFGGVMQLVSLDELYVQRERGAANSLLDGYAQTYLGYVFSPGLLVLGLYWRAYLYVACGLLGAVMLYAITAEKATLVYPVLVGGLYYVLKAKPNLLRQVVTPTTGLAAALLLATVFYAQSSLAAFVAMFIGFRSLLVPGVFVIHYADYFGHEGYTYWSHLRGLDWVVDVPSQYFSHPRWPSLGHLVGEEYLGIPTLNANASFLATDGIASLGVVGLVIIWAALIFFLVLLSRCSRNIPPEIACPMLLPFALTLTNGSLFTALTSFGGIVWLVCLLLLFKARSTPDTALKSERVASKL